MDEEDFLGRKPLPEQNVKLDYSRVFSEEEYLKLCRGLNAKSMDEKWNAGVYKNSLYMYRSWTGNCIYKVELEKNDIGYKVKEALSNRHPEQYNLQDNEYDALLLEFLVSNLILGESKPFPQKHPEKSESAGLFQHSVSGTGYKQSHFQSKKWWQFWK